MICPVPRAREYFVAENVTLGLDSRYVVSRGLELQIGTEKDKLPLAMASRFQQMVRGLTGR